MVARYQPRDMFGVPFDDIAEIVDRTPAAARQLASRARRRVRGSVPPTDRDLAAQRRATDAFLAAARAGDFEALLDVLDPDVVFRTHTGRIGPAARPPAVGAAAVAKQVLSRGIPFAPLARPANVNGGLVRSWYRVACCGVSSVSPSARAASWRSTWS
jgi:hypothetical protein